MQTRAAKKAQTRSRLLDAAAVVVAARGVEGATVDAIASGAGVTTGALYASFKTKNDLLRALIAERHTDLSGVPLVVVAESLGQRLTKVLDDNPIDARLFTELLAGASRDEELRVAMAASIQANVERLIGRLTVEGVGLRLSADQTALLLQVLVAGSISLRQVLGDELPPELLTDAVALLLQDSR
jgi:AcrR family transcriptional regulator